MSYLDDKSTTVTLNGGAIDIDGVPTPLPDFFRSANGANAPDGAADYTEAITHNGSVGIGQTADPISPLTFGNLVRNDVIRLWGNASGSNDFYGFGVNPSTLRYQVAALNQSHAFYGAINATSSKQFMRSYDRELQVGDPLATPGEGWFAIGTVGQGDNGYFRFLSPNASGGGANKIQAEIYFDGFSGNASTTGSTMEFRTAATSGTNTPLVNRMLIGGNVDLLISDPAVPYSSSTGSSALVTINGSLRMRGGAISVAGRQTGGIVFGAGPGGGAIDNSGALGDSDGGITSSADGTIDIYTNGALSHRFIAGGVAQKPGGGLWAALSDERVKRDISKHKPNPTATLALEPIEYFYNGQGGSVDNGTRFVGFSAQALQASDFAHWVSVGADEIDGDPVRQVDLSNLTFELLGVVKAQAQAIEALEQRLSALEPKPATAAQVAKRKV